MDDDREQFLVTAGGRITCLRCTARSSRTGRQCEKPALKVSRTQKCGHHGGKPHNPATIERISAAHKTHGEATNEAKRQARENSVLLHELEDAMFLLGMAKGPRTRGRRPIGYRGVHTKDDLRRLIHRLHTVNAVERTG